jgi:hypothetical protein
MTKKERKECACGVDNSEKVIQLLERITEELSNGRKEEEKKGSTKQIGRTKKVSLSLPELYWNKIDEKIAAHGNISSALRFIIMKYFDAEKVFKE